MQIYLYFTRYPVDEEFMVIRLSFLATGALSEGDRWIAVRALVTSIAYLRTNGVTFLIALTEGSLGSKYLAGASVITLGQFQIHFSAEPLQTSVCDCTTVTRRPGCSYWLAIKIARFPDSLIGRDGPECSGYAAWIRVVR